MTSIKEIAKEANVCPATVSRVLRHPELVSKQKREHVLEVIKRNAYVPNSLGVSLRNSKTYKLMAIIPDLMSTFNNPVIRAIESIALESGYSLLLGDTQGLENREHSFAEMALSRQVDGVLLFCSRLPFAIDKSRPIAEQLPPLVYACETAPIEGVPKVNINNIKAAGDGVDYLISLGHRRIATITGHQSTPSSMDRLNGYKQSLEKAGIPFDEALIKVADYDLEKAGAAVEKLLTLENPPTAIFAFSDEMALSCLGTLYKLDINVPKEISVLGFDNISYAKYSCPSLTTIAQPFTEIGSRCMELMLPQLKGEPMKEETHTLPHKLIIRNSTGPVN